MGRNSVAMIAVSHNRSMLTKKANVKFFPVTKDEYSHKKNHAIFIVRHAIFKLFMPRKLPSLVSEKYN